MFFNKYLEIIKNSETKGFKELGLPLVGVIIALLIIARTGIPLGHIETVATAELGVVHRFGKVESKALEPGLHYLLPWESVEHVNMQFDDMLFTQEGENADPDLIDIACATRDGMTISLPVSVSWAIDPRMLTAVKARLPGYYHDRLPNMIRSAVQDACHDFAINDGSIFNRNVVQQAIDASIRAKTIAYYREQGYGDDSDKIVRYGLISLRGYWPSDDIVAANEKLVTASLEAQAQAARTAVAKGRTTDDYMKVLQGLALARALEDGKANVTVVTGDKPPAAIIANTGPK